MQAPRHYNPISFVVLEGDEGELVPFVAARDVVALLRHEATLHSCDGWDAVADGVASAAVQAHQAGEQERDSQAEEDTMEPAVWTMTPLVAAWAAFTAARKLRRAARYGDVDRLARRARRSTR